MIRLPLNERPRERLSFQGPDALSIAELLAIILGSGTKDKSVLELARELLSHFGGLSELIDASIPELMQIKGIGKTKAIELQAVFALVKRIMRLPSEEKTAIRTSKDAYFALADLFEGEGKEKLAILLLDSRGKSIHREVIGIGTLTEVLFHPREIFFLPVKHKAHSFILAHNHPSGDPTPSESDKRLTDFLFNCAKIMDIQLSDHLIVGKDTYYSFRDEKSIDS